MMNYVIVILFVFILGMFGKGTSVFGPCAWHPRTGSRFRLRADGFEVGSS